jgi:hypothetical protein
MRVFTATPCLGLLIVTVRYLDHVHDRNPRMQEESECSRRLGAGLWPGRGPGHNSKDSISTDLNHENITVLYIRERYLNGR